MSPFFFYLALELYVALFLVELRWPAAYFFFVFLFLYISKILAKIFTVLRKNLRGFLFISLCVHFEDLCGHFHEDLNCKILKDLGKIIEGPNRL